MGEPYVGQISMVGFNFPPRNWALCNGQLLSISEYPTLYAVIGTRYGGNGTTNFALPDMRGRVPLHKGTLANQWHYSMGEKEGVEQVTLNPTELPEHTHTLMATQDNADAYSPVQIPLLGKQVGKTPSQLMPLYNAANPTVSMASDTISSTGGNQAHYNIQPVQVINFIIALDGVFPPRN